jgi:hypothetical protein
MRIFSKFIFLCNLCFVAAVVLRFVENANKKIGNVNSIIKLQPLQNTLVVLGYGAIVFNLLYHLILLISFTTKSSNTLPKWVIWSNFLFLIIQVYYFFFYE